MNDEEKYRVVTYSDFVKEVVREDKEKRAAKKKKQDTPRQAQRIFR